MITLSCEQHKKSRRQTPGLGALWLLGVLRRLLSQCHKTETRINPCEKAKSRVDGGLIGRFECLIKSITDSRGREIDSIEFSSAAQGTK
jgi:hypothetical protein